MITKSDIKITADISPDMEKILTPKALEFIEKLYVNFDQRRRELLDLRQVRQKELNSGKMLDFLPQTKHIRDGDWKVAPCRTI